jgi:hypothetical protein
MSGGRIVVRRERGPGWSWARPAYVAACRDCGTELARRPDQGAAERAAGRRRCPGCGSRAARRLAGTTSLAADLARAVGWPAHRRQAAPPLAQRASRGR